MLLSEFLDNFKSSNNEKPTHTSMTGGKWTIPSDQLSTLYQLINEQIINGTETIPLVEKIGDIHPCMIDIDIKYLDKNVTRQYTDDTIKQIADHLWSYIKTYFQVEDSKDKFSELYILQKSKSYPCSSGNYKTKDGIHLMYPNIILEKDAYKQFISIIKEDEYFMKIFEDTCEIPPSNGLDTLIDGCFTSWQPYGCSKVREEYYKLTNVGNVVMDNYVFVDEDTFECFYSDNVKLMKAMSMCRPDLKVNIEYSEGLQNKLKKKSSTSSNVMDENNPPLYPTQSISGIEDSSHIADTLELNLIKKYVLP